MTTPLIAVWMRTALWATAAMNVLGVGGVALDLRLGLGWVSLPSLGHPVYACVLAEFVVLFGLAYAHCAWTGRAPRVFIGLAAAGKLSFFATLAGFAIAGSLPAQTALLSLGDLLFGCLFLVWLAQTRSDSG